MGANVSGWAYAAHVSAACDLEAFAMVAWNEGCAVRGIEAFRQTEVMDG